MSSEQEKADAFLRSVREFGLTYPETHLKSPWPGHNDLAVRDKTFAYLSVEGQPFSISCKLPFTGGAVKRDFPKPCRQPMGSAKVAGQRQLAAGRVAGRCPDQELDRRELQGTGP